MDHLLYRMVERIFFNEGSFSRNKNFEAFEDPKLRKATRIVRLLKSLRKDLLHTRELPKARLTLDPLQEDPPTPTPRYKLTIAHPQLTRTAFLNTHELSILARDTTLSSLFQTHPSLSKHISNLQTP